ncbi:MAG: translation elongation factor 4 [Solobacterium sp.]|nr:translation elongation factor 4 [Solobacterium sp.]MDY3794909.1 translation elongation factor 4 [Erysipelotrichaceae bacterium]MDY4494772.1 translation elongation factor 4 [Erysipelotrichaceae bacterium]MDY4791444.1 translation elongation factor 4 [Erysipelotrichaceae bacterium]MDY5401506.1 translation elongation factor 4 [Erysipelotrichaceae bacterium]
MMNKNIRNFSIIAHIDHGKSTLADRILELTNTVTKREMVTTQILDSLDLEQERGITIKLNVVQIKYHAKDGQDYTFHLIDTPGHVDFTYEVSRSLAACDGAILVVDASQGIEAQTLANTYLALDNDLEILPVINKIDLPSADVERTKKEIEDVIGLDCSDIPCISAKTGLNVEDVLESIVNKLPCPKGEVTNKLQALVFDSYYDSYRGVVVFVCVKEGKIKVGDKIRMLHSNTEYEVTELGVKTPNEVKKDSLSAGEVGYICASIKSIQDVFIGDTITLADDPCSEPLPGYRKMNPMVYCGMYPTDNSKYNDLRDALEKLQLNDSSLTFEAESSKALGFGFRIGFLGLLHMEVIQERLEREYNLNLIATAPSVVYKVTLTDGSIVDIDNPSMMPDNTKIDYIEEPYVKASIMVPSDNIGPVMELSQSKRGIYKDMIYIDDNRNQLIYEMPLSEIIFEYFDKLKSVSRGYASLDYELIGYRKSNLVKMDILLNGEMIDALSIIVHRDFAYNRGQKITAKLKELLPKQQFEIPVQAAIGNKIIARTNIKSLRKDVLAKCYGGDISRKKKLLEKQKEGKKRMKAVGSVEIPQEAFMAVLSLDDDE